MEFYDQLSDLYDLVYVDWNGSVEKQARDLDAVIVRQWPTAKRILDVSCGIGTQTLGLSKLGYDVAGSDLSPGEIRKAQLEAEKRGLSIQYSTCDMRKAHTVHAAEFDVVISCDNSIAHLLSDAELSAAFESMNRCVKPGGGCMVSLRNYDSEPRGQNIYKPYGIRVKNGRRYVLYQIWDFEGDLYDLSFFFIEEQLQTRNVQTHVFRTRCNAISADHAAELIQDAGFVDVQVKKDVYFQPIIVGTKLG